MLRTKLFRLSSLQEQCFRHGSLYRPSANGQTATRQHAAASQSKILQSLKLLFVVMKLAEVLDNDDTWQPLQCMLMDGHSHHAQEQLRHGQLTSKYIGNCSGSSLLQAITSCYKGCLSITTKELQDCRKAVQDAQHLARLSRSQTFPTKSYQQHQQTAQRSREKLQCSGGSDVVATLITRILARLVNYSCLPTTARLLMCDSGLPEAVLGLVMEAGYFDHCEVIVPVL